MNFCVYNYSRDRMVEFFQNVFVGFRLIDVLDIVIVAYLVYKILGFIQEPVHNNWFVDWWFWVSFSFCPIF